MPISIVIAFFMASLSIALRMLVEEAAIDSSFFQRAGTLPDASQRTATCGCPANTSYHHGQPHHPGK